MADTVTSAATAIVLAGTSWIIDTGGRLPPEQSPSIAFEANGAVSGFSGCNAFRGSYEQSGSKVAIKDVASTRKACEDRVMIRETSYLKALGDAQQAEIVDGKLTLKRDSGSALQQFVKRPGK